jgi:hypothetical protein
MKETIDMILNIVKLIKYCVLFYLAYKIYLYVHIS